MTRASDISVIYQYSVSNNQSRGNISHFKIIDQDTKQVAREVREALHIRNNNPAINYNREKLYIPEIVNKPLGADGSTSKSKPNGRLRLPTRSHSSYSSKQQVCQSSVFGKLSSLGFTTQLTGILPCHQLASNERFYLKV